ncbi:MAG: abortive infection family protein [Bacteroidetes bacterium]|nr:abortive infection family protein [Bacteroidota bacterium]MDE2671964.1 abortive infection family protein [Bacteroidota bacterium]
MINKRIVSPKTRQNIIDCLRIEQVAWMGTLDDVEFLQRIYDLESLPSNDSRFNTAKQDIWQHRYFNDDWEDDWIYGDSRFDLLNGPTVTFLQFLCQIVHPAVRSDQDESRKLVGYFNDQLRFEGWQIVEEGRIAGRPYFVARQIQPGDSQLVSRARSVATALDAAWMNDEIERLREAIDKDPSLAIGTAKDLVETCCKTILSDRGVQFSRKTNLPKLTKLLANELKLVPEGISDEAKGAETIRLILSNLSALTHHLAKLRGLYGTGHGRDGKHRGLTPRHARLAVGAAVTFIEFMAETHHQRGN